MREKKPRINTARKVVCLGLVFIALFVACEWFDLPEENFYEEKIVINGLLIAHTQLSPKYDPDYEDLSVSGVRINRSSAITEAYDENSTALSDAVVQITKLENDLENEIVFTLLENDTLPGVFHHPTLIIEEGRTYRIFVKVTLTNGKIDSAWAETTVPSMVRIEQIIVTGDTLDDPDDFDYRTIEYQPGIGDSVSFLTPVIFSFRLTPENEENSPLLVRIMNYAIDERLDKYLEERTPENKKIVFDSLMISEDDTLKSFLFKWHGIPRDSVYQRVVFHRMMSFNMTNFTNSFKMSWLSFTFYGLQNISLVAMDEAYYNYHKGNLDGLPNNPIYMHDTNVENGYGLFASGNMGEPVIVLEKASFTSSKFYFLKRLE